MDDKVCAILLDNFKKMFGEPERLESSNGWRFRSRKNGVNEQLGILTLYNKNIQHKNIAEVAINCEYVANKLKINKGEAEAAIEDLADIVGNSVKKNKSIKWPRIGIASIGDANFLLDALCNIKNGSFPKSPPAGQDSPESRGKYSTPFERDESVKAWVLNNARGICEGCVNPAPFIDIKGSSFLEVHHVLWLSQGGSDKISNVVALCPNCHRRAHYSQDRDEFKEHLYRTVERLIAE